MKILIVDDDKRRGQKLLEYLLANSVISESDITFASCVNEAKLLVEAAYFDVLILDVVLPRRHNETPDAANGIAFLGQLNRSPRLKKPEKIIGVTAHLKDIGSFREEFEQYCLTVIEAAPLLADWKSKLLHAISYMADSHLTRTIENESIHVLAVHGIRTFGLWQNRLGSLIASRTSGIGFSAYKYGYFSMFAFLIIFFRNREILRLKNHIKSLFTKHPGVNFVIYCHSFGTYLVANALRAIIQDGESVPVRLLVLGGSVLPSRFDWRFLEEMGDIRIVNDCASNDYVLWFSEAFVYGTGMAGKTGFWGIQGDFLVNRFFKGGHSCFFDGDFMKKYWFPLLDLKRPVSSIDCRLPSAITHGFLEKIIVILGAIKNPIYIFLPIFLVLLLLY